METPHDNFFNSDCPSSAGYFDEWPDGMGGMAPAEIFSHNLDPNLLDFHWNDIGLQLDHLDSLDPLLFQPAFMAPTSLPSSSSPSSGESAFTSPLVAMSTPSLSPELLALRSPREFLETIPACSGSTTTHSMEGVEVPADYSKDTLSEAPVLAEVQESPSHTFPANNSTLTMADRPPGVSS